MHLKVGLYRKKNQQDAIEASYNSSFKFTPRHYPAKSKRGHDNSNKYTASKTLFLGNSKFVDLPFIFNERTGHKHPKLTLLCGIDFRNNHSSKLRATIPLNQLEMMMLICNQLLSFPVYNSFEFFIQLFAIAAGISIDEALEQFN